MTRRRDRTTTCLSVHGELDLATVPVLREEVLRTLTVDRPGHLVLDLAGVTFCDSTGIDMLGRLRTAAIERGVVFRVDNPRGITLKVMEILGVADRLTTPA